VKLCGRNFLLLKKAKKNILAFTKSMNNNFYLTFHKSKKKNRIKKCGFIFKLFCMR